MNKQNKLKKKKKVVRNVFFFNSVFLKSNIKKIVKPINKKISFKGVKVNSLNSVKINKNNFLKNKIMNVLHFYTGYPNINILGKPITLLNKFKKEHATNIISKYIKFYTNLILKNKYNKLYFEMKYDDQPLKNPKIKSLIQNKVVQLYDIKSQLDRFLRRFPFYILKIHKKLLIRIFYFLTLKNQDPKNIFLILKNSFYIIYKAHGKHFFRAFKFYKSLINKLYYCNLLKIKGLKLIFKGRFGKVLKQIQKLSFGSLSLNKVLTKITYYNSIMLTKRGSYGFHMWISSK